MKKLILAAVLFIPAASLAGGNLYDRYDQNDPYKRNGDPDYRYRGSTGTQYRYDLSKPIDRMRYQTDVNAQMRDSLNVDPRVGLDRSMGQYGGGIRR